MEFFSGLEKHSVSRYVNIYVQMTIFCKSLVLRDWIIPPSHSPRCRGTLMFEDLCSDWFGACFRKPHLCFPLGPALSEPSLTGCLARLSGILHNKVCVCVS